MQRSLPLLAHAMAVFARRTGLAWGVLLLLGWGLLAPGGCLAQAPRDPLELPPHAAEVDAWPSLTVLADPARELDVATVLRQLDRFEVPRTPRASLGPREGAVWLHLPLRVAAHDKAHRVLQIDSAQLERVAFFVVRDGVVVQQARAGHMVPLNERSFPSPAPTLELDLEPGRRHDVLMRVEASPVIVPVTVYTAEAFRRSESREQMVQGLIAGLALCLLIYSLAQFAVQREPLFLYYGTYVLGAGTFGFAYFGMAQQHLWPEGVWLQAHVPELLCLAFLFGILGFTEHVLAVRQWSGRMAAVFAGIRHLAVAAAAGSLLDVIGPQTTALLLCVLAPSVMLLSMGAAWVCVRRGDRPARYMLAGWVIYTFGMVVFIGTFQGLLPATWWTQRSLTFMAPLDMAMWLLVLAMRLRAMRHGTEQARAESSTLHSLAHTDALTRLPNRRGLQQVLERELPHASAQGQTAVYLLDLDGFKAVNDRLGHEAGDELLVAVAQRLKALLRASDVIARIGGDEFVVVAAALPNDAEARRLGHKMLEGIRAPFEVGGRRCEVGLTIGYVLAPPDGVDASDLLRRADQAMYAGKRAGRHCLRRSDATAHG